MMTDPISDFLIQIKNGYLSRKETIVSPYSKMKEELGTVLVRTAFAKKIEIKKDKTGKKEIIVSLTYEGKKPKLTNLVRVSRPGKRVYVGRKKIPFVLGGLGITILSTPKGLMSGS